MAYASKAGRARVSEKNPQAQAVCMRCGIWYNRVDLKFQFDWRGATLQNLYILVCPECYDEPQEQLRAIVLPADPVPIFYPSVEDFAGDETNYRTVSQPTVLDPITGIPIPSTTLRTTEDCNNRTTFPFGRPVGLDQNAVMPLQGQVHYGMPLNILSVTSDGSATVTVTCSSVHNLVPQQYDVYDGSVTLDPQVSVEGLNFAPACGFYSVNVLTATAFSYQTYGDNPPQSLLTPTTRIVTANVGLPLGYTDIPKIYGPPLNAQTCVFELEKGNGFIRLEQGGYLIPENCGGVVAQVCLFELESGLGVIALENGSGDLQLEMCNQTETGFIFGVSEFGVGSF